MPFEITIRQTGLFRRRLEIDDLTAGILKAGSQDRFLRFSSLVPDEGFVILYDPRLTGTGIRVRWAQNERDEICLQLPGLTTPHEIALITMIAGAIMKKWHAKTFILDNQEFTRKDLEEARTLMLEKTKHNLAEASENYTDGVTLVHGALWPLTIETGKLRAFAAEDNPEGFEQLLHDLQKKDYYWCSCHVYLSDDGKGYQGVYTVTAGVDTIIPKEPFPPVGMIDPATGDAIQCGRYFARCVTQHSRRTFLQTDYRKFLQMIRSEKLETYDACHVIIPSEMKEELMALEGYDNTEGQI